jgi:hypothetical protein
MSNAIEIRRLKEQDVYQAAQTKADLLRDLQTKHPDLYLYVDCPLGGLSRVFHDDTRASFHFESEHTYLVEVGEHFHTIRSNPMRATSVITETLLEMRRRYLVGDNTPVEEDYS